jgi:N-acetylglucosamine-6-phosphate deacetylase
MQIPGFVDLQVNGYAGVDFLVPETTVDDILRAAETLRQRGTAGFLLTVTTNSRANIETNVRHAREAMDRQGPDGPILGIHLEGPFISPEYGYRGAHMEKYIQPPDIDWFRRLQDAAGGAVRLVTLAPELPGALEFIRAVTPQVAVATGHANPGYDQLRHAVDAGLTLVTHFGNGVRPDIPRHDNVLVSTLACPELDICFIADGHHLPEPFLRMLIARVPLDRLAVVSDTVMYAGLQPGLYSREDTEIRLRPDGRLCLANDERLLYGSSANMLECINHLASLDLLTPEQMLQVGLLNPLRMLGIPTEPFLARRPTVRYDEQSRRWRPEKTE